MKSDIMTNNTSDSSIHDLALSALDDLKAQNVITLDVESYSDVFDRLIIASGTSSRHVKSLADNVIETLKKQGNLPIGVEGKEEADWVLVDYGSVVVHIMQFEARAFYELEKLWSPDANTDAESQDMPLRE